MLLLLCVIAVNDFSWCISVLNPNSLLSRLQLQRFKGHPFDVVIVVVIIVVIVIIVVTVIVVVVVIVIAIVIV